MNPKHRHYDRVEEKRELRQLVSIELAPLTEPQEPRQIELPLESNEGYVLRRDQVQLKFQYQEPKGSC